jgi:protein-S-isoprenylcysteine O-methyltransferase Ste14
VIPIIAGTSSFLFMLASDWADLRGASSFRGLFRALAFVLFAPALAFLALSPRLFAPPLPVLVAAVLLALVSLFLLATSLFFELRRGGAEGGGRRLVTTGSYALTRHPGLLWLFAFHASLFLMTGSGLLLLALPIWTAANGLAILVEDRIIFPRIFGEAWKDYRSRVPFLLPTVESARLAWKTRWGRPPARAKDADNR